MLFQTQSLNGFEIIDIFTKIFILAIFFVMLLVCNQFFVLFYKQKSSSDIESVDRRVIYINFRFFMIYFFSIFYFFSSELNLFIGGSTFIITIAGLGSTIFLSNIIGRLYIYVTRPFWIGELISVKGNVGIVQKIGLNFTVLKTIDKSFLIIPNDLLINATVLNTKNIVINEIKKKNTQAQLKGVTNALAKQINKNSFSIPSFFENRIGNALGQEGIYKFPICVEIELNVTNPPLNIAMLTEKFENVTESFTPIFGFKPKFFFGNNKFRQDVYFILTTNDVHSIYRNYSHFLEFLAAEIYSDLPQTYN